MWTNSSESGAPDDRAGSDGHAESGVPGDERGTRVHVGVADLAVTTEGASLETSGLGSCVAVAVYDERPDSSVGGLLHAMLPCADDGSSARRSAVAKYVDSGLDELASHLESDLVARDHLVAKVAGGSDMLGVASDEPIGGRNVAAARTHLDRIGVPVVAEDVGGDHGRSVRFDPSTGVVSITSAHGDDRRI
jgi:chemotaxis protein CheD